MILILRAKTPRPLKEVAQAHCVTSRRCFFDGCVWGRVANGAHAGAIRELPERGSDSLRGRACCLGLCAELYWAADCGGRLGLVRPHQGANSDRASLATTHNAKRPAAFRAPGATVTSIQYQPAFSEISEKVKWRTLILKPVLHAAEPQQRLTLPRPFPKFRRRRDRSPSTK